MTAAGIMLVTDERGRMCGARLTPEWDHGARCASTGRFELHQVAELAPGRLIIRCSACGETRRGRLRAAAPAGASVVLH